MCRLTIYKGRPILIGSIVIEPENSLLFQSRDAAYHPGVVDKSNVRNILVNGDGFGISWYGDDPSKGSCCFKFVTPAWSDTNLRNIGRHVASPLIFAHVRAAASGHDPFAPMIVSNENCHPFTYKEYTFMHNGGIPSFQTIKLKLLNLLSPETYANIKGTTDTEHIFALFLNCLPPQEGNRPHTVAEMVAALNQTISIVLQLCTEGGITDHCSLNLCVTNGIHIIATRFRSGPKSPPSLYYNFGSKFVCRNGAFYAEEDCDASEIVISSAPLSKVSNTTDQCVEVELEVSYTEEDDNRSLPLSPSSIGPNGVSTSGGTARGGGLRKSYSANSLRAVLQGAEDCQQQQQQQQQHPEQQQQTSSLVGTGETDSDAEDVGSWILIPKNHMLVCRGNVLTPDKVEAIYLERIIVKASSAAFTKPLYAGIKRKVSQDQWYEVQFQNPRTQALATSSLTDDKRTRSESMSITYGERGDEFSSRNDSSTSISACVSLTSTEGGVTTDSHAVAHAAVDRAGACPMDCNAGSSAHSTGGCGADIRGVDGAVCGPPCTPSTPGSRHKPKCIKFTCKM